MPDSRTIIECESDARSELISPKSLPLCRSGIHHLPFTDLSGDEFEIFCFLLLKSEYPDDKIIYYGKTKDLGRDIVHERADGCRVLIQCNRCGELARTF